MSSRAEVEARWERRSVSRVSGVVGVVVVVEGSAGEGILVFFVFCNCTIRKVGEFVLLKEVCCVVGGWLFGGGGGGGGGEGDRFVRPEKLRGKRNIHDSCEVSNYVL